MSAITSTKVGKINWRRIGFLTLSALTLLLRLPEGVLSAAVPWFPQIDQPGPGYTVGIHNWHNATFGIGSLFMAGLILGLLKRPQEKPVLFQLFLLANIGSILIELVEIVSGRVSNLPFTLVEILVLALFVVCYPSPRTLLRLTPTRTWSKPILVLCGLMTVFFAPDIWRNLQWELTGVGGEHLYFQHWLWVIFVEVILVFTGVAAATRQSGWLWAGTLVGLGLLYLGPAATATQGQAGSWGMTGGILSALLGATFITTIIYTARRENPGETTRISDINDL